MQTRSVRQPVSCFHSPPESRGRPSLLQRPEMAGRNFHEKYRENTPQPEILEPRCLFFVGFFSWKFRVQPSRVFVAGRGVLKIRGQKIDLVNLAGWGWESESGVDEPKFFRCGALGAQLFGPSDHASKDDRGSILDELIIVRSGSLLILRALQCRDLSGRVPS